MEMLHTDNEQQDEEFQEADILWPEDEAQGLQLPEVLYYAQADPDDDDIDEEKDEFSGAHRPMKVQIGQRASSPIDIPGRKGATKGARAEPGLISSKLLGASRGSYGGGGGGSVMIGGRHVLFVPPHVIVDRRAKRDKAMMMFVVPSGRPARRNILREHCY